MLVALTIISVTADIDAARLQQSGGCIMKPNEDFGTNRIQETFILFSNIWASGIGIFMTLPFLWTTWRSRQLRLRLRCLATKLFRWQELVSYFQLLESVSDVKHSFSGVEMLLHMLLGELRTSNPLIAQLKHLFDGIFGAKQQRGLVVGMSEKKRHVSTAPIINGTSRSWIGFEPVVNWWRFSVLIIGAHVPQSLPITT